MKKEVVLLDTIDHGYDYQIYLKDCLDLDNKVYPEDSQEFYDWVESMKQMDYDFFNDNVRYSKSNRPCIITGTLGLWFGEREINPYYCSSLEQAISTCWGDSIQDVKITRINGIMHIDAYHHDGCNRLDITILSDKGIERYSRNGKVSIRNRENVQSIDKDSL